MKKTNLIGLFILCLFLYGCGGVPLKVVSDNPGQMQSIHNIAVIPFDCNRSETGQIITRALAANLDRSRFSVMDQSLVQKMLDEQRLTSQKLAEDYQSVVGKLKGVDAVITGRASVRAFRGYIDSVAETTARLVDLKTGKVLLQVHYTSADISRFSMQGTIPADQIGKEMAQKFSAY